MNGNPIDEKQNLEGRLNVSIGDAVEIVRLESGQEMAAIGGYVVRVNRDIVKLSFENPLAATYDPDSTFSGDRVYRLCQFNDYRVLGRDIEMVSTPISGASQIRIYPNKLFQLINEKRNVHVIGFVTDFTASDKQVKMRHENPFGLPVIRAGWAWGSGARHYQLTHFTHCAWPNQQPDEKAARVITVPEFVPR